MADDALAQEPTTPALNPAVAGSWFDEAMLKQPSIENDVGHAVGQAVVGGILGALSVPAKRDFLTPHHANLQRYEEMRRSREQRVTAVKGLVETMPHMKSKVALLGGGDINVGLARFGGMSDAGAAMLLNNLQQSSNVDSMIDAVAAQSPDPKLRASLGAVRGKVSDPAVIGQILGHYNASKGQRTQAMGMAFEISGRVADTTLQLIKEGMDPQQAQEFAAKSMMNETKALFDMLEDPDDIELVQKVLGGALATQQKNIDATIKLDYKNKANVVMNNGERSWTDRTQELKSNNKTWGEFLQEGAQYPAVQTSDTRLTVLGGLISAYPEDPQYNEYLNTAAGLDPATLAVVQEYRSGKPTNEVTFGAGGTMALLAKGQAGVLDRFETLKMSNVDFANVVEGFDTYKSQKQIHATGVAIENELIESGLLGPGDTLFPQGIKGFDPDKGATVGESVSDRAALAANLDRRINWASIDEHQITGPNFETLVRGLRGLVGQATADTMLEKHVQDNELKSLMQRIPGASTARELVAGTDDAGPMTAPQRENFDAVLDQLQGQSGAPDSEAVGAPVTASNVPTELSAEFFVRYAARGSGHPAPMVPGAPRGPVVTIPLGPRVIEAVEDFLPFAGKQSGIAISPLQQGSSFGERAVGGHLALVELVTNYGGVSRTVDAVSAWTANLGAFEFSKKQSAKLLLEQLATSEFGSLMAMTGEERMAFRAFAADSWGQGQGFANTSFPLSQPVVGSKREAMLSADQLTTLLQRGARLSAQSGVDPVTSAANANALVELQQKLVPWATFLESGTQLAGQGGTTFSTALKQAVDTEKLMLGAAQQEIANKAAHDAYRSRFGESVMLNQFFYKDATGGALWTSWVTATKGVKDGLGGLPEQPPHFNVPQKLDLAFDANVETFPELAADAVLGVEINGLPVMFGAESSAQIGTIAAGQRGSLMEYFDSSKKALTAKTDEQLLVFALHQLKLSSGKRASVEAPKLLAEIKSGREAFENRMLIGMALKFRNSHQENILPSGNQ